MRTLLAFFISLTVAAVAARADTVPGGCRGDFNNDGQVTIDEIIVSVNNALNGCPPPGERFQDNGDGTISDTRTGLQWEKKSHDGSIHDQDFLYTWSASSEGIPDGTAFSEFLASLNTSPCFAGHCDWRLPTTGELQNLVDHMRFAPAIDPAFTKQCTAGCLVEACGCTNIDAPYWTTSEMKDLQGFVWTVDFNYGYVTGYEKTLPHPARAVRSGT